MARRLRASGRVRHDRLAALDRHLRNARVVDSRNIPRNVVTLNSRVSLKDLDSRRRLQCTLTDPHDTTLFGGRVSVAAPAGIALLGRQVGQVVHWMIGNRIRRFRIEQVLYQPEAAGDYHL
jgi:regulator of nucleoside diphosphate kinase